MTTLYLDESGDLGWKFDKPYRAGGSSRHLTIAGVFLDPSKKHFARRLIVDLQKKVGAPSGEEVKWALLEPEDRKWVAERIVKCKNDLGELLTIHAMTVKKVNVAEHIRQDSNKLYNYMVNLLLTKEMSRHAEVTFIPDQRTIKVKSGNSMHDYIQTELWFTMNAVTKLSTKPQDSKTVYGLQLADLVAGIVQSHKEDGKSEPFNILSPVIAHKTLF